MVGIVGRVTGRIVGRAGLWIVGRVAPVGIVGRIVGRLGLWGGLPKKRGQVFTAMIDLNVKSKLSA